MFFLNTCCDNFLRYSAYFFEFSEFNFYQFHIDVPFYVSGSFDWLESSAGKVACLNIWDKDLDSFVGASSCDSQIDAIYSLSQAITLNGDCEGATMAHPEFDSDVGKLLQVNVCWYLGAQTLPDNPY